MVICWSIESVTDALPLSGAETRVVVGDGDLQGPTSAQGIAWSASTWRIVLASIMFLTQQSRTSRSLVCMLVWLRMLEVKNFWRLERDVDQVVTAGANDVAGADDSDQASIINDQHPVDLLFR